MESRGPIIRNSPKVTKARLYPELNRLIQERVLRGHLKGTASRRPEMLHEALREYVYNEMPFRLILLPQRKLVERSEIVEHIAAKMDVINESLLFEMHDKIRTLGKTECSTNPDEKEEDAGENPWGSIYQFLFQKYGQYAILSHTWLPKGEILYQHVCRKHWWKKASGPGLDKLRGFCDVTHHHHDITLAWIDTLCINKDSSAELDESIQSMYKWYHNSSVCITHLRDTTSLENMESDNWFRRGWTLQELIAPRNMHFYGKKWNRLAPHANENDKANPQIQEIIHRATGIKPQDLVSFDPLTGSDVPTRMRWAANRKTTRGEDRAYSLMGIFGVHFSISYGEGAERAFFRLIAAIISSRHTPHIIQVLHWAGKAIPDRVHPSNLIPSSPECYLPTNIEAANNPFNADDFKQSTYYPTLSRPMVLTHLGLRVKLLLFRLSLLPSNGSLKVPPSALTFSLKKQVARISATESLLQFYNPRIRAQANNSSFFLGIYTFKQDNRNGCIYLPFSAYGFLLGTSQTDFSMQNVSSSDFRPSSKIETREVVRLYSEPYDHISKGGNDVTEEGCLTIPKKSLEALNLKLITVYL
ncbi:hypothetical protein BDN70DRAFT_858368 [Pholiota conissans]|uniref:Heterokaryon incompatibility domain-containing protein n=1 Tax=Pholiota conissans TaxID=109636 RepID=A0A9P6D0M3_9AGAR|nr:hypothetical protein BDN70DRAFT_858368 [Pholiota conissans]